MAELDLVDVAGADVLHRHFDTLDELLRGHRALFLEALGVR